MAWRDRHEADCQYFLDDPMSEVHKWLDAYAEMYPVTHYLDYHRRFRHNRKGVEFCRKTWGDKGYKAAMLHLLRDYRDGIRIHHHTLRECLVFARKALKEFEKEAKQPHIL